MAVAFDDAEVLHAGEGVVEKAGAVRPVDPVVGPVEHEGGNADAGNPSPCVDLGRLLEAGEGEALPHPEHPGIAFPGGVHLRVARHLDLHAGALQGDPQARAREPLLHPAGETEDASADAFREAVHGADGGVQGDEGLEPGLLQGALQDRGPPRRHAECADPRTVDPGVAPEGAQGRADVRRPLPHHHVVPLAPALAVAVHVQGECGDPVPGEEGAEGEVVFLEVHGPVAHDQRRQWAAAFGQEQHGRNRAAQRYELEPLGVDPHAMPPTFTG